MTRETTAHKDVIVFTDEPELQEKMRRKRDEYVSRYAAVAPEASPHGHYKLRLISELIEVGVLDVDAVEAEFLGLAWHDRQAFGDAVGVVRHYNQGQPERLRGGTGLA